MCVCVAGSPVLEGADLQWLEPSPWQQENAWSVEGSVPEWNYLPYFLSTVKEDIAVLHLLSFH